VNWQEVNSLVRPGIVRLFTYQCVSRGATGLLYFLWRQARIGSEKILRRGADTRWPVVLKTVSIRKSAILEMK